MVNKFNKWKNFLDFVGAFLLTGGFIFVFSEIISPQLQLDIFILITLPLLIGSVLSQKEYKFESLLFLESSILMIFGFLIMFSTKMAIVIWPGIFVINIGAFIFSYALIKLSHNVGRDIANIIYESKKGSL